MVNWASTQVELTKPLWHTWSVIGKSNKSRNGWLEFWKLLSETLLRRDDRKSDLHVSFFFVRNILRPSIKRRLLYALWICFEVASKMSFVSYGNSKWRFILYLKTKKTEKYRFCYRRNLESINSDQPRFKSWLFV